MIKIAGILFIGISSGMIGFRCSFNIKKRIDMLTTITYILGEFADRACFSREPIPEIIKSTLSKTSGLYYMWLENLLELLNRDNQYNFMMAWVESLNIFRQNGLQENELNILKEFGIRIVNLNEDRLEEILHKYINLLEEYISELKADYKVKSKLYQSMGVLMGLFIIIIVI